MMSFIDQPLFWIMLGLALLLLEMVVPGVYLLWLGVAALLTALPVAFLEEPSLITLGLFFALFVVVSLIVGIRLQAKLHLDKDAQKLNQSASDYIGETVRIASRSTDSTHPLIHLNGTTYLAHPARSGEDFEQGDEAVITSVEASGVFKITRS